MGLAEVAEKVPGEHCAHAVERDAPPAPPAARYPAGQATQSVLSGEENVPAGHAVHDREPAREVAAPGAHTAHALIDTAPLSALAVPGGHMMQEEEVCPVALLYVPAGQELQLARAVAPLVFRKRPAGQGLHEEEPGAEAKAPKLHGTQKVDPAAALKDPGEQGAQASAALTPPALLPHVPGGHMPVHPGCPAKIENEPFAQGTQAAAEVEPVAGLAVPAGQAAQNDAPLVSAKLPAEQVPHDVLDDAPSAVLARPGAHAWHAAADGAPVAALHVPTGHGVHTLLDVAPTSADHVPTGQTPHCVEPDEDANVPGAQGLHASVALAPPALLPHVPGGHMPVHPGCPAKIENEPFAQGTQAAAEVEPVAGLAVPGGQAAHTVAPPISA